MSWPSPTRQLLVVTGLTGFAISQPVLSVLGEAPTELAYYGVDGSSLVWLACLIAFVPPTVLWGLSRLGAAIGSRLDRWLHLLTIAGLVGLFTIQLAKTIGLSAGVVLLALAILAGLGFVALYVRLPPVATWASYTAVLPVMAVVFFLFVSPASALLTSTAAPERVEGAEDLPNVVMIILDELPTRSLLDGEGQIDTTRFPNLAAFSEDATWYRHNSSIANLTEVAVPGMLTGNLPKAEEAVWTNHPDNLFTILAPTHELEAIEVSTELCPYDVCQPTGASGEGGGSLDLAAPGLGDALGAARDVWFDRVGLDGDEPATLDDFAEAVTGSDEASPTTTPASPSVTERPGVEERVDNDEGQALTSVRTQAFIDSFDASKDPALYYLHLMIPHQPFKRYDDGTEYRVFDPYGEGLPEEDNDVLFSWSPWTSAVSEQQHLFQAQYADRLVGEIVGALRDEGLYDDSLVIVTSDHGISFEDRTPARYFEPSTVDAIGYAPLLLKRPGQTEGAVDDSNVNTTDVLPTILDIVGVELPHPVDGAVIGSDAIEARGTRKQAYDMMGFGGLRLVRVLEYDDRDEFPTVEQRLLGPLADPADPLAALYEHLGIEDLRGRPLDDVVTGTDDASVGVDRLDEVRQTPDGTPPFGMVSGIVDDAPDDARLLLAVDGVVVGGSALSTDSSGQRGIFAVLLPAGALDGENDIRAALVDADGGVLEVDVRSM